MLSLFLTVNINLIVQLSFLPVMNVLIAARFPVLARTLKRRLRGRIDRASVIYVSDLKERN